MRLKHTTSAKLIIKTKIHGPVMDPVNAISRLKSFSNQSRPTQVRERRAAESFSGLPRPGNVSLKIRHLPVLFDCRSIQRLAEKHLIISRFTGQAASYTISGKSVGGGYNLVGGGMGE
jgi:hypothetical protein